MTRLIGRNLPGPVSISGAMAAGSSSDFFWGAAGTGPSPGSPPPFPFVIFDNDEIWWNFPFDRKFRGSPSVLPDYDVNGADAVAPGKAGLWRVDFKIQINAVFDLNESSESANPHAQVVLAHHFLDLPSDHFVGSRTNVEIAQVVDAAHDIGGSGDTAPPDANARTTTNLKWSFGHTFYVPPGNEGKGVACFTTLEAYRFDDPDYFADALIGPEGFNGTVTNFSNTMALYRVADEAEIDEAG